MRPMLRSATILVVGLALSACGAHGTATATASLPPMLIESKGFTMPLQQAITKIAYRPYIPPRDILAFAVIPPLGGLDTPANRGIAIEYVSNGQAMLLSQWPRHNLTVEYGTTNLASHSCKIAKFDQNVLGWISARGFLITLQGDGQVKPASVDAEAKRLVASGACR